MGVALNAPAWNVYRFDLDRAVRYDGDEIARYTKDLRARPAAEVSGMVSDS